MNKISRRNFLLSSTAAIFITSCAPVNNETVQSTFEATRNPTVDPILAHRKTINPFLAWNRRAGRTGNRYGLAWTADPQRRFYSQGAPLIRLSELYWNYYYPNKAWLNYQGIERFLTNRNWGHGAEYGATLATDITSTEFISYIA